MTQHFSALEADFDRFYRLDLTASLWGASADGVRRTLNLVRGLPADSAFAAGLVNEEELADRLDENQPRMATREEMKRFFGTSVRVNPEVQHG